MVNFNVFNEIMNYTTIGGVQWIVPLAVSGVILFAMTKDNLEDAKIVAFPLMYGLTITGLQIPLMIFLVTGIMYVQSSMSLLVIGEAIKVASERITGKRTNMLWAEKIADTQFNDVKFREKSGLAQRQRNNQYLTDLRGISLEEQFGKGIHQQKRSKLSEELEKEKLYGKEDRALTMKREFEDFRNKKMSFEGLTDVNSSKAFFVKEHGEEAELMKQQALIKRLKEFLDKQPRDLGIPSILSEGTQKTLNELHLFDEMGIPRYDAANTYKNFGAKVKNK